MIIYYVHGFNSGPNSSTGKKLVKEFPDDSVKILAYDSSSPFEENLTLLAERIAKDSDSGEDAIIVGASLGGYYAAWLAEKFALPAVLINPVYSPAEILGKFVGENASFEDGHKWELTKDLVGSYKPLELVNHRSYPKIVLIGKNDDVIDPEKNISFWQGKGKIVETDDGHSIASFEPIKKRMQELPNLLYV